MSINNFIYSSIRPLNILKKRKLSYLPLHFKCIEIEFSSKGKIDNWVKNKLQGRYCIVNTQKINEKSRNTDLVLLGFEEDSELTYFILACPFFRR